MTIITNKTVPDGNTYSYKTTQIDTNTGNTTNIGNGTVANSESNRLIRDGVGNAKHKEQIRLHQNANTLYIRTVDDYERTEGSYDIRWIHSGSAHRRVVGNGYLLRFAHGNIDFALNLPTATVAQNIALMQFIAKANRELRTSQGLVSLGELRETIHAIRHPLESLKKGMAEYLAAVNLAGHRASRRSRSIKRGIDKRNYGYEPIARPDLSSLDDNLSERGVLHVRQKKRRSVVKLPASHARAISDAISGTYLEYANGWGPLIRDIDSTARTLAEHYTASGVGYKKISSLGTSEPVGSVYRSNGASISLAYDENYVVVKSSSCRIKGEVVVSHTGSREDLLRSAGFTLGDFGATLWELLPLSYVAGYFFNMSQILEAYAFNWAAVSWSVRSTRVKTQCTMTGTGLKPAAGLGVLVSLSGDLGRCVLHRTVTTRDGVSTRVPSLAFSLPGTHLLQRLANVSALAAQARSTSRQLSRLFNG